MSDLDSYLDAVLIGGKEPIRVVISDYDPEWPARYEAERERIASALEGIAVNIEHIGSTAVPGLAAKPIIDVLVTVREVDPKDARWSKLEGLGYRLRVREPDHLMFKSREPEVNLHVWPSDHEEVGRYLLLRDWLRYDAGDRLLYERRKRDLANEREWPDVNYYADAKSAVVAQILERARQARNKGLGPWAA